MHNIIQYGSNYVFVVALLCRQSWWTYLIRDDIGVTHSNGDCVVVKSVDCTMTIRNWL